MKLKLLKIARFFHLISKRKYNEKRQIEIVKKSPLFDAKWYLVQNPDIKSNKIGAAKHYVKYGWKEGRNPSKDFDGNAYLQEYPELVAKNWCPLFHYMILHKELMPKVSIKEIMHNLANKYSKRYQGKSNDYKLIAKSEYFNKRWYLKQYPDVKKAGIDPIEHYLKYGWKKGRNPSKKFDTKGYLARYNDVKNANMNPLLHYLKYGIREGREVYKVATKSNWNKNSEYICSNGNLYKIKNVPLKQPKFSVIMPTYNRAFCICRAIDSLLNQTYQNFELIIIDDGSTDETDKLLQQKYKTYLDDGKISYIYKENSGVCKTRNIGLNNTKNEWIAYLDSDNTVTNDFLQTFAIAINTYKKAKTFYAKLICQNSRFVLDKEFNRKNLISQNFIDLGVFVHHRSYINLYGGFDENMSRLVDWELIARYTKKEHPVFIDHTVLIYNDSNSHDRITNSSNYYNNLAYFKNKHSEYPLVTTMITTYNHEKYIAKAIDSAIMQVGDIRHEILISDDGSTDNTPQIIEEYAKKYPHLIRNISKKENVGISENMKRCFMEAQGKYIAVLEGDDYWTDVKKLEKQVTFLEKNKDCSMVFSRTNLLNKPGKFQLLDRHNGLPNKLTGDHFIKELSLIVNFSCCMFKTDLLKKLPEILYKDRLSEISLAFYLEKFGKIGFISEPLSVYRQHVNGVWTGADRKKQLQSGLQCRQTAYEVCRDKYKAQLKKIIDEQYIKPLNELENKVA